MDLGAIVRNAVAIAHANTESLQATVVHTPQSSTKDAYGKPQPGAARSRTALVERRHRLVRTKDGREIDSLAKLTFLEPTGIVEGDTVTLPEGDSWIVLQVKGLVDPGTGQPFVEEVYLGASHGA